MSPRILTGGGDDAVALCIDDAASGAGVLWFGEWPDGAADSGRQGSAWSPAVAPIVPQRWGARLDDDAPLTLHPGAGAGQAMAPAVEFRRADGRWRFEADRFRVDDEAAGLRVLQGDSASDVELTTALELDPGDGALRVHTELINRGDDVLDLRWLAVCALPLPHWCTQALDLSGDWCGEFQRERIELGEATWLRESREGRSSHRCPPGVLLLEAGAVARRGRALGVQLAWSGDHRLRVDRLPDGRRVLQVGVLLHPGEALLGPGERHASPALWLSCSARGLDGAAARMHALYRRAIRPPTGQRLPRPVHLNTWEAVYFDHDPQALADLARAAADVGVERFVLDDGWFTGRVDDARALGDWTVDAVRYPEGLGPLVDQVQALGMEFGLWVEPEMVNDDSQLARAHPDWIRGPAPVARAPRTGRHQRVLDLTRPEVCEHLFSVLDALLSAYAIGYLKWDHNRVLTESATDGTAGHLQQTHALYALVDRLRRAHPHVEIESCASGGGRADLGMLTRMHRVWVSDCNDPVLRARIMAGAAPFLAPEVAGCHVGPERAHTTGRHASLDFRASVALLGVFGLELDVRALDDAARARLAAHVARFKRWRQVTLHGRQSTQEPDADHLVRLCTSDDRSRALLVVLRLDDRRPGRPVRCVLEDLDPARRYRISLAEPLPDRAERPAALTSLRPWLGEGTIVDGAWLISAGLTLQFSAPQRAAVFEIVALEDASDAP